MSLVSFFTPENIRKLGFSGAFRGYRKIPLREMGKLIITIGETSYLRQRASSNKKLRKKIKTLKERKILTDNPPLSHKTDV